FYADRLRYGANTQGNVQGSRLSQQHVDARDDRVLKACRRDADGVPSGGQRRRTIDSRFSGLQVIYGAGIVTLDRHAGAGNGGLGRIGDESRDIRSSLAP